MSPNAPARTRPLLGDYRPFAELIPDSEEFAANPAAALTRSPIVIGPLRPFVQSAALILILVALWVIPSSHVYIVIFRITMSILAPTFLIAFWWPPIHLALDGHGVEFHRGRRTVRCPWALFTVAGQPTVLAPIRLKCQCRREAIPWVEHLRDGVTVGYGTTVRQPGFRFRDQGDTLVMDARYEIHPKELGDLLIRLGHLLGNRLPSGAPPALESNARLTPELSVGRNGWLAFRRATMHLPAVCCRCDRPTTNTIRLYVEDLLSKISKWLSAGHGHLGQVVAITVPICLDCRRRLRRVGLVAGILTGVPLAALLFAIGLLDPQLPPLGELILIPTAGAAAVGLIVYGVVEAFARGRFIKAGTFSERRGTISLRFGRPTYIRRIIGFYGMEETSPTHDASGI